LTAGNFDADLAAALRDSGALRDRFRRVAMTGLMLLRHPIGGPRRVGGHDWAQRRLFEQIGDHDPDFVLLRQAERETREQFCDAAGARQFLEEMPRLELHCRRLPELSPFAESWMR